MPCPSCGCNTNDPQCWHCQTYLDYPGVVRLSDTRWQYKPFKRTFYIHMIHVPPEEESTRKFWSMSETDTVLYISDQVDPKDSARYVCGTSLTHVCANLRDA